MITRSLHDAVGPRKDNVKHIFHNINLLLFYNVVKIYMSNSFLTNTIEKNISLLGEIFLTKRKKTQFLEEEKKQPQLNALLFYSTKKCCPWVHLCENDASIWILAAEPFYSYSYIYGICSHRRKQTINVYDPLPPDHWAVTTLNHYTAYESCLTVVLWNYSRTMRGQMWGQGIRTCLPWRITEKCSRRCRGFCCVFVMALWPFPLRGFKCILLYHPCFCFPPPDHWISFYFPGEWLSSAFYCGRKLQSILSAIRDFS